MRSRQAGASVGVGFQQLHRQPDQVVEVDRVEGLQALPGSARTAPPLRVRARLRAASAACSGDRPAFFAREIRLRIASIASGLVPGRSRSLTLRGGVVGVEDREAAAQPGLRVLDLQEAQAERMEGADRQAFGRRRRAMRLADALAHFARGLVGEGDRGDALGRRSARCAIRCAIFSMITRVLPLPAPASTSSGPSVCSTAAAAGD